MDPIRKPTRTISGVTPLAVMLPPRPCPHGLCTFCPQLDSPQSYTPKSPVVLRAKQVDFSAYKQVENRLINLKNMGHSIDKVELIIMGGTFLSYPLDFQYDFIKDCYDALNEKVSESLNEAKKFNETSLHRCVALCIETRPDVCSDKEIKRLLEFGCTRVELGVQNPDDKIYKLTKRGHTVKDLIDATKRLKKAGFKVGYHLMPGLPGSNLKKDLSMFKSIFSKSMFKPDQIKIYPCQVLKGSELEKDYLAKKFIPYNKTDMTRLLKKVYPFIPRYCRIMRLMREIPSEFLVAGMKEMDLRKDFEEDLRNKNVKINEIRFREIGFNQNNKEYKEENVKLKLKTTNYLASDGEEYFLEIIDNNNLLYALLRLRLEKNKKIPAMIRELHVYGKSTDIGKEGAVQHKGLGKELILQAEKIAIKKGYLQMRIISGVGVRQYYKKMNYSLDKDGYMLKGLK